MDGSLGLAVDTLSLGNVLRKFQAIRVFNAEVTALFLALATKAPIIIIAVAYDHHCVLQQP